MNRFILLMAASLIPFLLASYRIFKLQHVDHARPCKHLEQAITLAIGVTSILWAATGLALLVSPDLRTPVSGDTYNVARGTVMLFFSQGVGWTVFFLRQWRET